MTLQIKEEKYQKQINENILLLATLGGRFNVYFYNDEVFDDSDSNFILIGNDIDELNKIQDIPIYNGPIIFDDHSTWEPIRYEPVVPPTPVINEEVGYPIYYHLLVMKKNYEKI